MTESRMIWFGFQQSASGVVISSRVKTGTNVIRKTVKCKDASLTERFLTARQKRGIFYAEFVSYFCQKGCYAGFLQEIVWIEARTGCQRFVADCQRDQCCLRDVERTL